MLLRENKLSENCGKKQILELKQNQVQNRKQENESDDKI